MLPSSPLKIGANGPLDPKEHSHRRRNPLTGEWVIVSPHRTRRPWSGATSHADPIEPIEHDPECYLCPGNERAGGTHRNPEYQSTFVFQNDFAALNSVVPTADPSASDLFQFQSAEGECRVICFSPNHSLTLGSMSQEAISTVIDLWRSQTIELESIHRWVQIFETRGDICGSSNPHPHGQIWASSFLPDEPAKERERQAEYRAKHGTHLLLDYVHEEVEAKDRVVASSDKWAVVVPYWAYWPFETIVLPRTRIASLSQVTDAERDDLAKILKRLLSAYDSIFQTPFPYCSGWHSGGPADRDVWQLHAHYYPPLLRSADVAKIPASYEVLAEVQRDFTPEHAAERLRALM